MFRKDYVPGSWMSAAFSKPKLTFLSDALLNMALFELTTSLGSAIIKTLI